MLQQKWVFGVRGRRKDVGMEENLQKVGKQYEGQRKLERWALGAKNQEQ